MTPKGHSPVDPVTAEHASPAGASRRSLFGAVGAAGLAGVAAALLLDRTAQAVPTDADIALLERAMLLELTARDLYEVALEAAGEDEAPVVRVMRNNHQSYAQAIAGAAGLSARGRVDEVFDSLEPAFGSAATFAEAAHSLEQTAVATHTALLEDYESDAARSLTASILVMEARMATVLAVDLGVDDLDVLFGNDATPLELEGGGQ